ncbi:hypothetical protein BDR07DRAFT_1413141 [Suillus spraguei]|nr:hypothetical protein BDR07DRAFT_1413141 [Suillus spraguei]
MELEPRSTREPKKNWTYLTQPQLISRSLGIPVIIPTRSFAFEVSTESTSTWTETASWWSITLLWRTPKAAGTTRGLSTWRAEAISWSITAKSTSVVTNAPASTTPVAIVTSTPEATPTSTTETTPVPETASPVSKAVAATSKSTTATAAKSASVAETSAPSPSTTTSRKAASSTGNSRRRQHRLFDRFGASAETSTKTTRFPASYSATTFNINKYAFTHDM